MIEYTPHLLFEVSTAIPQSNESGLKWLKGAVAMEGFDAEYFFDEAKGIMLNVAAMMGIILAIGMFFPTPATTELPYSMFYAGIEVVIFLVLWAAFKVMQHPWDDDLGAVFDVIYIDPLPTVVVSGAAFVAANLGVQQIGLFCEMAEDVPTLANVILVAGSVCAFFIVNTLAVDLHYTLHGLYRRMIKRPTSV